MQFNPPAVTWNKHVEVTEKSGSTFHLPMCGSCNHLVARCDETVFGGKICHKHCVVKAASNLDNCGFEGCTALSSAKPQCCQKPAPLGGCCQSFPKDLVCCGDPFAFDARMFSNSARQYDCPQLAIGRGPAAYQGLDRRDPRRKGDREFNYGYKLGLDYGYGEGYEEGAAYAGNGAVPVKERGYGERSGKGKTPNYGEGYGYGERTGYREGPGYGEGYRYGERSGATQGYGYGERSGATQGYGYGERSGYGDSYGYRDQHGYGEDNGYRYGDSYYDDSYGYSDGYRSRYYDDSYGYSDGYRSRYYDDGYGSDPYTYGDDPYYRDYYGSDRYHGSAYF